MKKSGEPGSTMLTQKMHSQESANGAHTSLDSADIVMVGNGIAGLTAALEARSLAPEKRIAIITEQSHPTINTPALKQFAAGKLTQEQLLAYPAGTERARNIEVINAHVEEIHSKGKYITLHGGQQFGYHSLLLATGSKPNGLPTTVPGYNFDGVLTLHRLNDYLNLQRRLRLREIREAVVIGGGTHAMETVMGLLERDIRVHWLIRSATFLPHALDRTASEMVLEWSKRPGLQVSLETEIVGIVGRVGSVVAVVTNQQKTLPCQLVLVCTGTSAVTTLAERCDVPLKQQHGLLVDEYMRTSVRDIFAAGDAAAIWNSQVGTYQQQANWHAAVSQGRAAAIAMTGFSEAATPSGVPWHATQLGELSLLTVGHPLHGIAGATTITNRKKESYRCLSVCNDRLVGYLSLGKTQPDGLAIKRLIDEEISVRDIERHLLTGELDVRQYFARQHFSAANALVVTGEWVVPVTANTRSHHPSVMDAGRQSSPFVSTASASSPQEMPDTGNPLQKRIERQTSSARSITSHIGSKREIKEWIVPSMLPEGLIVLAGKQKVGKSWLGLAIGLGIASGEPVPGSITVEQGQVLYLALNESKRHVQERLSQLLVMGASLHRNFEYMTHWQCLYGDSPGEIEAWLVSHPQARLVIVDSWVTAQRDGEALSHGEDASGNQLFERLRMLAHAHHICILVHFHTNDAKANRSFDILTARSGNNTCADGILHLKGGRANKDATLSGTGRAYAQGMNLALSFNNGLWQTAGQPAISISAPVMLTQARQAIIDVMHDHGRPMKPGEIALVLGKRSNTIRTMLYAMKANNIIRATEQGYVALIPKTEQKQSGRISKASDRELSLGRQGSLEEAKMLYLHAMNTDAS